MNELKIENQWIWKEMEGNMNVHYNKKINNSNTWKKAN